MSKNSRKETDTAMLSGYINLWRLMKFVEMKRHVSTMREEAFALADSCGVVVNNKRLNRIRKRLPHTGFWKSVDEPRL